MTTYQGRHRDVIVLHPHRLCDSCEHFDVIEDDKGLLGLVCRLAREPLDDITVAATCPGYEPEGLSMTEIDIKVTGDDEKVQTIESTSTLPVAPPIVTGPAPSITVNTTTAAPTPVAGPLPAFEKVAVQRTEIKITGTVAVDTRDEVTVGLDDRLRVCGEFRVTKVNHYVDRQGNVVRQQVLAPITDLELVPWDASNPLDNGIVRAHV